MCIKTHLNTRKIPVHENAHSLFKDKIQCTLYYSVVVYSIIHTYTSHVHVCKQKQLLCVDMNNVIILKQTWLEDKTPNLIKRRKT